jgi:hypothetical protein
MVGSNQERTGWSAGFTSKVRLLNVQAQSHSAQSLWGAALVADLQRQYLLDVTCCVLYFAFLHRIVLPCCLPSGQLARVFVTPCNVPVMSH